MTEPIIVPVAAAIPSTDDAPANFAKGHQHQSEETKEQP